MNDSLLDCVYCLPGDVSTFPVGKGSEEHVLIAALGGRKVTRNLCCQGCNNRLGTELDAEFAEVFAPIANMFNAKRARKGDAPTLATEEKLDGHPLQILPGLKFSLRGSKIQETELADGNIGLTVSANTREDVEKLMANYLKKFPDKKFSIEGTRFIRKSTAAPLYSAELKVDEIEKRCAAKMMLALLATSVAPERLRSDSLRDIVCYINGSLEIGENFQPWLNMSLPERKPEYEFGHALMVVADRERSLLIGVLQIYGTIAITGIMSECWDGPDIGIVYWVDPVAGASETIKFAPHEITRSYPRRRSPSDHEHRESLMRMMQEIQRRHRDARTEELIDGLVALKESSLPDDQKEKAADQLIESYVMDVLRIDHERELP